MNNLYDELAAYITDYTKHFDHFPEIFEYENIVYNIDININDKLTRELLND